MTFILQHLGKITIFLSLGIYAFGEELVYFITKALTYAALGFFITVLPISFDIATEILTSLDLSTHMMDAWLFIPIEVRQALAFFKIPEVLSILIVVGLSKFVLRFVPGL